jgi:hypothetical protein
MGNRGFVLTFLSFVEMPNFYLVSSSSQKTGAWNFGKTGAFPRIFIFAKKKQVKSAMHDGRPVLLLLAWLHASTALESWAAWGGCGPVAVRTPHLPENGLEDHLRVPARPPTISVMTGGKCHAARG